MEGFPSLTREKFKVIESVEKLGGEKKRKGRNERLGEPRSVYT